MALLHGQNPLEVLDVSDPIKAVVLREVINRAEEIRHERDKAMVKAWEAAVTNGIARAFR